MKLIITMIVAMLLLPFQQYGQVTYETINSAKLGEARQIKIQLPRNYKENTNKHYPVMVVLDGDYLFEPVAGMVDYYSYWEEAPEMIVVGIKQGGKRMDDTNYDNKQFLPAEKGAKFFEFLGMELLASMDQKYRTADFKIIVGHDFTSNFINYYLLKDNPVFDGYINISPDLAPEMSNRLVNALSKSQSKKWYYLATGGNDIPELKKNILDLDASLSKIDNENLDYNFDNFKDASHYSLVAKAIPSAIGQMFEIYRPISIKDYNEILLQTSISPSEYLADKYESIEELYSVKIPIRISDFMAIYNAIEKTRRWDEYKPLYKMAYDSFPGTMLGTFFEARYEEELGNPKRAMRIYQNAYGQQKVAFLDSDFMLKKADAIKKDFGY
ncbi:alpha/beta hydrolase-fold protein [Gramella sp. AN32]|uniref:Alpha/beta hydrolase n=1 Tax=Christiangramia antarctica TaxID=2058158 RepID=A0ABW5X2S8_9FLAO|nr:alpha/beta hydrolase-fold protein [Gramella sp. AN32]MCM4155221.1 esterase [Gramella sp. AN32]